MTHALALESQVLAHDLYELLRALDPAAWKDDLEQALREQLEAIIDRLNDLPDLSDFAVTDERLDRVREQLWELARTIEEAAPDADATAAELRAQWLAFRDALQPDYEALAAALRPYAIHVPSLRPTNYTRNVFHVASGVAVLLLIQHLLTPTTMAVAAGAFMGLGWSLEIGRRVSRRINQLCMLLFRSVAHPHEAHRVNSSTWYVTALFILALTSTPLACSLAVIVLGFGDPIAAIIGRRWGRTRIANGRSLEGSLAFITAATLASLATMSVYFPGLGLGTMLLLAVVASTLGAFAEMYSRSIDDNLSIPLSAAAGAGLVILLLGL